MVFVDYMLSRLSRCVETSPSLVFFIRWFSALALLLHGLHLALVCTSDIGQTLGKGKRTESVKVFGPNIVLGRRVVHATIW